MWWWIVFGIVLLIILFLALIGWALSWNANREENQEFISEVIIDSINNSSTKKEYLIVYNDRKFETTNKIVQANSELEARTQFLSVNKGVDIWTVKEIK